MKNARSEKFMDIGMGKVFSKWLWKTHQQDNNNIQGIDPYYNISN